MNIVMNIGNIFPIGRFGFTKISNAGPKNKGKVKNNIDCMIPRVKVMLNNFLYSQRYDNICLRGVLKLLLRLFSLLSENTVPFALPMFRKNN
jgi:hypothetical protein